ncbi:hypothetical protein [Pseudomonas sp. GW531-T4]|uniref:hypothetical protein n=1 Tax=Pseudomonas sp. GW531-T4 TaxID=2075553 RepID=UPI000CD0387C|nr:hypothetical protein [Pseudomonas sp. GW531-T4]POA75366.1 hypothetical protein C1888_00240 [Pseudomonas sp. GW531-T4]
MIPEIEELLRHWGQQCRDNGSTGSMGSPMGTIMEWGGCAPRGTPGSRIILGAGAGPDGVSQEVAAALADIGRQDPRGERLERLAMLRYGSAPAPTVAMQVHLLDLPRQTYFDQVQALHLRLLQVLTKRANDRKQLTARRGVFLRTYLKVASK